MNKYIAIIPTYNNFNTIGHVVTDILHHNYKVIVIDDGSSTPLTEILEKNENLIIQTHTTNQGKGAAILTGVKKAQELGYTHAVSLDGDGQHLASQIQYLIEVSLDDEIIIGARDFDIDNVPLGSRFGRWFSNFWATWDTRQAIEDSLSGFRIYPISILDLDIKTQRFDWEMEVLVKHSWKNRLIKEVITDCYYPTAEERVSHFKKFWDTWAIVVVHLRLLPFTYIFNKFSK